MAYTSVPPSSPGIIKSRCVLRSANMSSISANNWSGSPALGWRKISVINVGQKPVRFNT